MKKILLLLAVLTASHAKEAPLPFTNGGLYQYEIIRVFLDCQQSKPDWKLFEISKGHIVPAGGAYLSIMYDCKWESTKGLYEANQISIQLKGNIYSDEIRELKTDENPKKIYFTDNPWNGPRRLFLPSGINSQKLEPIRIRFLKDETVAVNEMDVPLRLLGALATSITETMEGYYIIELGAPFAYTSLAITSKDSFMKIRVQNNPIP